MSRARIRNAGEEAARRRSREAQAQSSLRQQAALLEIVANAIESSETPEECARKLRHAAEALESASRIP